MNKLPKKSSSLKFKYILEDKLTKINEQYQHIFDNLSVGIWMKDSIDGKLTYISKGVVEIFQLPIDKLYREPESWKHLILSEYKEEVTQNHQLLLRGEKVEKMYRIAAGDGTTKWIYDQTIPEVNKNGDITHLFGVIRDISSEIDMQKRLEFLSEFNSITALPNQESLYKKLDEFITDKHIHSFALLYMDLDDFSWVTDFLGHPISDLVLKNIANKMTRLLPENVFLANLNYDNFILLIPNYTEKAEVERLAEAIITRVSEQMKVHDYEIYVTVSIGICFYPENGTDKLVIMESSHAALYHAKHIGKNNYQVYLLERDSNTHRKYMLEKDLRHAIENEEFEIYYQPQINPRNGTIEGAEALIRWHHKEWGVVSPGEFIPLAEQKHLIHDIGEWVIKQVCSQLRMWREQGYPIFPISVNVSPIQFLRNGLVECVKTNLEKNTLPSRYLELEITENLLLKNEQAVQTMIKTLKRLGVRISLDDFGKGYSSLHYLRKFDIDTLKIDQSFVQCLSPESIEDTAIVSSIIDLGKGLNMKLIAEGVEENEQKEFLKQKECDLVQGFLYSKPVPVDKFEEMIKKGRLDPIVM